MIVLHYNYVQPDEAGKPGGGVSVYLNNLVKGLLARGNNVILLSAGDRYTLLRRKVILKITRSNVSRAVIYNSPILGPFHFNFDHVRKYCTSRALDHIPEALKDAFGNVDVFHFHNIEGLTIGFFKQLRVQFPESKIIFSAHNYNIVCPQVNLWYNESNACADFQFGAKCVTCRGEPDHHKRAILIKRVRTLLNVHTPGMRKNIYNSLNKLLLIVLPLYRHFKHSTKIPASGGRAVQRDQADYSLFRSLNLELCLNVFDKVLAVSNRTREVLVMNGVSPSKIAVSYIGTKHFPAFMASKKTCTLGDGLHLAYLGYMRADKGFYFFLDCLEALPVRDASNITVTIAASLKNTDSLKRIEQLKTKFRTIRYFNGFTHSTLDLVLQGVNLGVIPVLWEDNLPQVAIEIVSRGIPVLVSDRGGAREIARNATFVFRAGCVDEFNKVVASISRDHLSLADFWKHEIQLTSMDMHVDELVTRHYHDCVPT